MGHIELCDVIGDIMIYHISLHMGVNHDNSAVGDSNDHHNIPVVSNSHIWTSCA